MLPRAYSLPSHHQKNVGKGMRRTTVGIVTAVAGQAMSVAAVLENFLVTPIRVCRTAGTDAWLVAAAIGPLMVFVGVALYIDGRSKRPGELDT